jgi:ATP-binding cassette subfamily B protein
VLWFGARLVIEQKYYGWPVSRFSNAFGQGHWSFTAISSAVAKFSAGAAFGRSHWRYSQYRSRGRPWDGTGLTTTLQGKITFEQVFFKYQSDDESRDYNLKNVSLTIEPGMFVGIVGRSGSGKSTLSKLIQRLYHPEKGRILLDGNDIKGVNLPSLRQQMGVVLQDDFFV